MNKVIKGRDYELNPDWVPWPTRPGWWWMKKNVPGAAHPVEPVFVRRCDRCSTLGFAVLRVGQSEPVSGNETSWSVFIPMTEGPPWYSRQVGAEHITKHCGGWWGRGS